MLASLIEVHRSPRRAECEERAFVLTAVGIPSSIGFDGVDFVLFVESDQSEAARRQLAQYAQESRPAPPSPARRKLDPHAWVGCVGYVLTLLFVGYAVAGGFWRLDAFELGAIDAARVKAGEWWRAWTALTLHADAAHLIANAGAGIWFGYLAGRQLGPGTTWLLTVLGAGLANLLEAFIGPATHRSVGASTAVFTVLGLLAAYTWRIRYELPQRWALRWGPLIAGAVMLALTGAGGPSVVEGLIDGSQQVVEPKVDVVAHVAGFVVGVAVGAIAALPKVRETLRRMPQRVSGALALLILAAAWTSALAS